MTNQLTNLLMIPILLVGTTLPVSASQLNQSPTERLLENQQAQMEELQLQMQAQRNQEQIERMQEQLLGQNQNQQPPVVVVEQKPPSTAGIVLGTLLGAALNNGYVNCGPNGNCGYGYGGGGHRYYGDPGRCAYRTGYDRCNWKLPTNDSEQMPDFSAVEREINNINQPPKPTNDLERYLGNANITCVNSYVGCTAGYTGIRW